MKCREKEIQHLFYCTEGAKVETKKINCPWLTVNFRIGKPGTKNSKSLSNRNFCPCGFTTVYWKTKKNLLTFKKHIENSSSSYFSYAKIFLIFWPNWGMWDILTSNTYQNLFKWVQPIRRLTVGFGEKRCFEKHV